MKVGLISLGCSKNLVDSEKMMGMLKAGGHELVIHPKDAEAMIINTCGFINSAKEEAINTIFEMAAYKQQKLKKLIVVGCLAQRYQDDLRREIPEIDAVISIREYPHFHERLQELLSSSPMPAFAQSERLLASKPWTAYLKIAEGCSNCCTYCAIPLIRGANVSFPIEQLVEEARNLAEKGVKELVLIAQDTTKYGVDLYGELSLLKLLRALHEIEGFHWIRILYMYPDEITEDLVAGMAELPKVVPYFDIPLQHANDAILKRMNRRGSVADIRKLIDMIRSYHEHPTLRTTFIVGFPQESETEFSDLIQFVQDIKWDRMGAFTYSPEESTPAFSFSGAIVPQVKEARLAQLMKLQEQISLTKQQEMVGKVIEVLVEGQDGLSGIYRGRSQSSAPDEVDGLVFFRSSRFIPLGSFVQVVVKEALPHDLKGEEVVSARV